MKYVIYCILLLTSVFTKAQIFNDFYIKQQLGFYEQKNSKAYIALETLKSFILKDDKKLYVDNTENEYYKEFSNIFFNPNLPQQFYTYVPTTYSIKDNIIIFEIDVIESFEINNEPKNSVYLNAYILVDLDKNKILLSEDNINALPNTNLYHYGNITIVTNHSNLDKKDIAKTKKYINQQAKILFINKDEINKQKLTIISSNSLNDGYFYYGINKYVTYVNNYKNQKIFTGNNGVFYQHEIIHYLLNQKTEKINSIMDEGLATWLGGSIKYSFEEFVNNSIGNKSDSEISSIITNFINDNNPDNNHSFDYYIRALFMNAIFESKDNIDEELLNKLISKELSNYSVEELIYETGLDKNEIKLRMMNRIKQIKNNKKQ